MPASCGPAEERGETALRVDEEYGRRVVDGIIAVGIGRPHDDRDAEPGSQRANRLLATRDAREGRVEVRDVAREDVRRVAAGVDADQRDRGAFGLGKVGERLAGGSERRERRRAYVRAIHEAEEKECPAPAQPLRAERPAVMVDEREIGQRARRLEEQCLLELGRRRVGPPEVPRRGSASEDSRENDGDDY